MSVATGLDYGKIGPSGSLAAVTQSSLWPDPLAAVAAVAAAAAVVVAAAAVAVVVAAVVEAEAGVVAVAAMVVTEVDHRLSGLEGG